MIGLEFIIYTYKTNKNQIANLLGVSRQTVNDWIRGKRPIPEIRLKQLSEHFGIQMQYFKKQLNDVEKIEIQKNYLLKTEQDFDFEHRYMELENELKQERTISKVKNSIKRELFDENETASLDNYIINVLIDKLGDADARKIIEFMVYKLDINNGVKPQFIKYGKYEELIAKADEIFKEIQIKF